jgi:hypothetical protein
LNRSIKSVSLTKVMGFMRPKRYEDPAGRWFIQLVS